MINDLEVLLGDVGTIGLEEEEESDDPDLKDEELLKIDLHVRNAVFMHHVYVHFLNKNEQMCSTRILSHI